MQRPTDDTDRFLQFKISFAVFTFIVSLMLVGLFFLTMMCLSALTQQ